MYFVHISLNIPKECNLLACALDIFVSVCHGRIKGRFLFGEGNVPREVG